MRLHTCLFEFAWVRETLYFIPSLFIIHPSKRVSKQKEGCWIESWCISKAFNRFRMWWMCWQWFGRKLCDSRLEQPQTAASTNSYIYKLLHPQTVRSTNTGWKRSICMSSTGKAWYWCSCLACQLSMWVSCAKHNLEHFLGERSLRLLFDTWTYLSHSTPRGMRTAQHIDFRNQSLFQKF